MADRSTGGDADPALRGPAGPRFRRQLRLAWNLRWDRVDPHARELHQHRGAALPPHLLALPFAGSPHYVHLPGHGLSAGLRHRARAHAMAGNLIVPRDHPVLDQLPGPYLRLDVHPALRGAAEYGALGAGSDP